MARHNSLVYVDDDIRCEPDFVRLHLDVLTRSAVSVVGGRVIEDNRQNRSTESVGSYNPWLAKQEADFNVEATPRHVHQVKGCNFSAKRSVLARAGGFDESLSIGAALHEELELCLRVGSLGSEVWYSGDANLHHLAASAGGTRQTNVPKYVYAFLHNRSILIQRYSRWYQFPSALAWSLKLMLAYMAAHRDPLIIAHGMKGMIRGWLQASKPRQCTVFVENDLR